MERIKLSNNSTPSQSVEMVDAVGSCKKDNSKPVNSQTDLNKYFKIRKQLWFLTHLELRLLKIDIKDHLQKWEGSQ
tara:strand:+ start:548 stop:775 length:228 start_codon:yes stop_codon:yes gene_type:complete